MYKVLVKLDDGEFLVLATYDLLEEATELVNKLKTNWPHEYAIRDSEDNNLEAIS